MKFEVGYRNNGHQFLCTKTDVRGPGDIIMISLVCLLI